MRFKGRKAAYEEILSSIVAFDPEQSPNRSRPATTVTLQEISMTSKIWLIQHRDSVLFISMAQLRRELGEEEKPFKR